MVAAREAWRSRDDKNRRAAASSLRPTEPTRL
jgi:hypothetical protein